MTDAPPPQLYALSLGGPCPLQEGFAEIDGRVR